MATFSNEANMLFAILGDRNVRYIPVFADKFGGAVAGLMLSQLVYWHGKQDDPDGWIRKTLEEFKEETGLTEREQERARALLKGAGVIEYKMMSMPAMPHYKINWEVLVGYFDSQLGQNVLASKDKTSQQARTKRPSMKGRNVLTNIIDYSENTPKSGGDSPSQQKGGERSANASLVKPVLGIEHEARTTLSLTLGHGATKVWDSVMVKDQLINLVSKPDATNPMLYAFAFAAHLTNGDDYQNNITPSKAAGIAIGMLKRYDGHPLPPFNKYPAEGEIEPEFLKHIW